MKRPPVGQVTPSPSRTRASSLLELRSKLLEAERLRQAGKLESAQNICTKLVAHYPDYVGALHTLGLIFSDSGLYQEAIPFLNRAAMHDPDNWSILTALGGAYLSVGATEMAQLTLERAKNINPSEAAVHASLGELHREQQEFDLAAAAFERACELDSGFAAALTGLGLALIHLARLPEAAKALEKSILTGPPNLNALYALANLPGHLVEMDVLSTVTAQLHQSGTSRQNVKTAYVRAAALNQRNRYSEAWEEYTAANKIELREMETAWKRQHESDLQLLERLKLSPIIPSPSSNLRDKNSSPVFILGPSRSGKTTAELLISSIPGVKRGFESSIVEKAVRLCFQDAALPLYPQLMDIPPGMEAAFRVHFFKLLITASTSSRVITITHPARIYDALRLAAVLPSAKFIMVKRNVDDVTARIFMKMYSKGHPYAYSVQSIRDYVHWYYGMMDGLTDKLPGRARTIIYEEMIAAPDRIRADLSEFCGIQATNTPIPELGNDCGCAALYPQQ